MKLQVKIKAYQHYLYTGFLLIVWLIFFLTIFVFNDTVIAWCKALLT